jgi:hypothetical protein
MIIVRSNNKLINIKTFTHGRVTNCHMQYNMGISMIYGMQYILEFAIFWRSQAT